MLDGHGRCEGTASSTWYDPDRARDGFVFFCTNLSGNNYSSHAFLFLPKKDLGLPYSSPSPIPNFFYIEDVLWLQKTACREQKPFEPILPCSLREFYPLSLKSKKWRSLYSLCTIHSWLPTSALSILLPNHCWLVRKIFVNSLSLILGFPGGSDGKESACNVGDLGSVSRLGRAPGEGSSYPL